MRQMLRRLAAIAVLLLLAGCAKTMLKIHADAESELTLRLSSTSTLKLQGPLDLVFMCRTWGDSYFEVGDEAYAWTCSGGQLSANSVALGEAIARGVAKGAVTGLTGGVGAAPALLGGALERRAPPPVDELPNDGADPSP